MSEHADYPAIRARLIEWLDDNYHFGDAATLVVSDDLSWLQGGVLDSLGFVKLILYIESTFGVELDRKDLTRENFDGMRKVIHYVTGHRMYRGVPA